MHLVRLSTRCIFLLRLKLIQTRVKLYKFLTACNKVFVHGLIKLKVIAYGIVTKRDCACQIRINYFFEPLLQIKSLSP